MGQCGSSYKHEVFKHDFGDDPSAFRVFIKRKNKFLQGWLKIADEEIIFTRGGGNIECWPLGYLRRYGYTRAGIFFFESGRRCKTEIRNSRASSVASQRMNSVSVNSRIYPVQRFSSEGANGQLFISSNNSDTSSQNLSMQMSMNIPNQAPIIPTRINRPKSLITNYNNKTSNPTSPINFIDSWPNEPLPPKSEIVNEHVLRSKKPCIDPICRQRKYHSYVNIDLTDNQQLSQSQQQQHQILNYSQGNLLNNNFPQSMSASYCGQPSTSTINDGNYGHHNQGYDPMTMSANAAIGQHIFETSKLTYATLAMPESCSSRFNPHHYHQQQQNMKKITKMPLIVTGPTVVNKILPDNNYHQQLRQVIAYNVGENINRTSISITNTGSKQFYKPNR
uniref:IRS-type PTB domain-containing protein n=1 Tax=Panagrolaimus sp. JU765 TaxID=591449 RepID=A0AC34QWR4_9BILA